MPVTPTLVRTPSASLAPASSGSGPTPKVAVLAEELAPSDTSTRPVLAPSAPAPSSAAAASATAARPEPAPSAAAGASRIPGERPLSIEEARERLVAQRARPQAQATAPENRAEEILNQIRMSLRLGGGTQEAILHLMPPELGRLSVRVVIQQGRVSAQLRAESEETLEILERHTPELRAAFARMGLDVEGFELELGLDDAGSRRSFDDADPSRAAARSATTHRPDAAASVLMALPEELAAAVGGVDTYA